MRRRIKVGVVFGGQSGEHEVSLVSSYNIISQLLAADQYEIILIGITKEGRWYHYTGDIVKIKENSWLDNKEELKDSIGFCEGSILNEVDVFFPVLHGPMGEDGTVQGFFELLNKPYVGCKVLASSVGMDKGMSKILFEQAGIPVDTYQVYFYHDYKRDSGIMINSIEEKFQYPVFIKPANMGSSVGISKAHNQEELKQALETAGEFDNKILVESFIDGREIECAVLQTKGEIRPSVLGEIRPKNEFYDYEAKYKDDGESELIIPAPMDDEIKKAIQDYAVKAFSILGCSGLTRVDFFLTHKDKRIYINEVHRRESKIVSEDTRWLQNFGIYEIKQQFPKNFKT
jgi:D-alanine-D-alanine ligase